MVLGGQVLSAQEKGFLSIFEDNQGMSMKPNDIVETPDGEFLIIANEDGGTKSKVLKIDADGILMDEIAIGAQDTVLKLNNLFLIQDDQLHIPKDVHKNKVKKSPIFLPLRYLPGHYCNPIYKIIFQIFHTIRYSLYKLLNM